MSTIVTNADGIPALMNCKLFFPHNGKTLSIDFPSRIALDDILPSISKVLDEVFFAKVLKFFYVNARKDLLPLPGDVPLCELADIVDLKRGSIDINVRIEDGGV